MRRVALALPLAAIVCLAPARAEAAKPTVSSKADPSVVAVGDVFEYTMVVAGRDVDLDVQSASPGNIEGFDLLGTSTLPQQQVLMHNGMVEKTITMTVIFRLRAKRLGTFTLGPGKFTLAGHVLPTPTVKVDVVPPSQKPAPKKKPPRPFHDPFDDFFQKPIDPEPEPEHEPIAPADPQARVDEAPAGKDFFVRLVPTDPKPVVGAQTTVKVFVYARRMPNVGIKRPPAMTEFRNVPLGPIDKKWQPITIGTDGWHYAAVEGWAAFPLRVGTLTIGPAMVETSRNDPFGGMVAEHDVESSDITVEAVEPPLEGRPPGYALGDVVSNLELTGDVAPRVVKDGHAVVTLNLRGAGRIDPLRPLLATPQGVTWTATSDDTKSRVENLVVYGARRMIFDARVEKRGDVDLGDVVVHVWDPSKKSYASARARLGRIRVEEPAAAAVEGATLAVLPPPRDTAGAAGEGTSLGDRPVTWGFVLGAPLVVLAAQAANDALRRRRERDASRRKTPANVARDALAEARAAKDDAARIAASARAVDRALEDATGIRARSLTRSELVRALAETELPAELQEDVARTIDALESARFAAGASPSVEAVTVLVERLLAHKVERLLARKAEKGA